MQLGAVTYNVLKDMDLDTIIKTLEATEIEVVELRTGHKHGVEPEISEAERGRVKARFEYHCCPGHEFSIPAKAQIP
jgi:hypothetical protein